MSDATRPAKGAVKTAPTRAKHGGKRRKKKWRSLDADGRERPAFLASFPRDPNLDALVRAFEAGNFALVRERAPRLAKEADDPKVRRAALELSHRIKPDPLLKYLLVMSVLLLVYLTLFSYFGGAH
jgi:hypothetical protein